MSDRNDDGDEFGLASRTLGGLPIVNQVLDRLGLPALLAEALPVEDARVKLAPAAAIRLVITNLVLGREPSVPIYPFRFSRFAEGDPIRGEHEYGWVESAQLSI